MRIKHQFFGWLTLSALILAGCFISCSKDATGPEIQRGIPEDLDDGWAVSTPQAQQMDYDILDACSRALRNGAYGDVHSFLVARNGFIVFEEYYRGWDVTRLHLCYSVTKSVTSAVVGIIRGQGLIPDLDRTLAELLPEHAGIINADADKQTITLRHVLSMTAGLEYDENSFPYTDARNSWRQMHNSNDWIEWALSRPIVTTPGTTFQYSSACTILLAGILENLTGRDADDLALEYLFGPLGIDSYFWEHKGNNPEDIPDTGGGLSLRPRDMLKFGQLYLNGGEWEGEQVVPGDWVTASTSPQVWMNPSQYYGYQWWGLHVVGQTETGVTLEFDMPYAAGYSGQFVILLPIADLVIVFTASNPTTSVDFIDILNQYIGPAVLDF